MSQYLHCKLKPPFNNFVYSFIIFNFFALLSSRDSLTDAFGDSKGDNDDYRKSPGPEDDMLSASTHQRPSGMTNILFY